MKKFYVSSILAAMVASASLFAAETKLASLDTLRDKEVVELFRSIPVQEAGRIKPLDTVARFRLLRYFGKESISLTDNGLTSAGMGQPAPKALTDPATGKPALNEKGKFITLSGMEWMLVTWFRPDLAKDMQVFVVDNSDAVIEIGVKAKGKRDRYSYNELLTGRPALMKKMGELRQVEEKARTPEQRSLGKLAMDFLDYEMMLGHMDFARAPFGPEAKSVPPEIMAPADAANVRIETVLPKMAEYFKAHPEAAAPMANPWLREFYRAMLGAMMSGNEEMTLRIFPSSDKKTEVWRSPGSIMQGVLESGTVDSEAVGQLAQYNDLFLAASDPAAFKAKLKTFHDSLIKASADRGEGKYVPLEISYHKTDYFINSLVYFIIGLLALALSWTAPQGGWGKWCVRVAVLMLVIGAAYATAGIVVRCIIMQRPPITTLYETILFITTAGVILSLIAEWLTRDGIALLVAALAGTVGMFLSIRFMEMEGTDTLQQLQAVLITNFWLATHVPCINLGYAAGMVAAIISMIYLVQRMLGLVKHNDAQAKDLTRIAYGFVMAGLFLSLVGTVLGGIWANYSWGRFWGWDPKENGALMIVLMNLIILHARLGHYIHEVGFHACNIILGMIVAFSWFGVNQLGVGLHAYGFTEGIWFWLATFWGSQALLLVVACVLGIKDRQARHRH